MWMKLKAEIGDDKSASQRRVYLLFAEGHKGTEPYHSDTRGYSLVAAETRA
jgi:hypothetical protein